MAHAVGCRVTGIDHAQKLIDIAGENRRASRLGDRVSLVCCRAEQYEIRDENAFFFFNPFSDKVFEGVLRRLERAHRERKTALTLLCYYPSEEYIRCLENAEGLCPVDDIDCGDLYHGKNPRERILVYRFPAGDV